MTRSPRAPAAAGLALAACLMAAGAAHAAGAVEVQFIQPENFIDIGFGSVERERNVGVLRDHFKRLGERLPDGQVLKVDVLEVDLAGQTEPWRRNPDIRVLRGRADWPRMTLRWSLAQGGQVLRSGEDRIADMAYLGHSLGMRQGEALAYDRRMVDEWFGERVLGGKPAP